MKERTKIMLGLRWMSVKGFLLGWIWKWQNWRRSRNPELVELDAYRTMKRVDEKLKEWPHAIPLLEAGLEAAKITGMDDKWYSYAVRLRDYTPPERVKAPGREIGTPSAPRDRWTFRERVDIADKRQRDYLAAIEVIRATNRASVSHFQRKLGWGYNYSASIVDLLESRGVIGPQTGAGPREILNVPAEGAEFIG